MKGAHGKITQCPYILKNTSVGVRNGCQRLNVFCGVNNSRSFLESYVTIVEEGFMWPRESIFVNIKF